MSRFPLHPATRLIVWLFVLIAVQTLSGLALPGAALAASLLGAKVLRRARKLIWRTRWLLLSLFVILAWGTAGNPLWAASYAPTEEGLALAGTHLGRLLLVLLAVAAFLETMSLPDLLTATHTALSPLRRLGLDPDRSVVRLMLALRYAEDLPRPRDWKVLLDVPSPEVCDTVEIQSRSFSAADAGVLLLVALAAALLWLN